MTMLNLPSYVLLFPIAKVIPYLPLSIFYQPNMVPNDNVYIDLDSNNTAGDGSKIFVDLLKKINYSPRVRSKNLLK